jgi:hypothetical protein
MMDLNLSRIREIRDELQNLFSLIKSPRVYTDYDRYNFLSTELDTLVNILNGWNKEHTKSLLSY